MDQVEELRRVVGGYRKGAVLKAPKGLLDAIGKLDKELGPSKSPLAAAPTATLENDLRSVATKLVKEGGVSNVAGTLLHGVLAQLGSPGRPAGDELVIDQQPVSSGQLPEPPEKAAGYFPSPS